VPERQAHLATETFRGRCIEHVYLNGGNLTLRMAPREGEEELGPMIILPWPWRLLSPPNSQCVTLEGCRDMGSVAVVAEVTMWRHEYDKIASEVERLRVQMAQLRGREVDGS
jgi:hypothetical protein